MGRMLPVDCERHGTTVDWGDFGPCQGYCEDVHPEDLDNCPDSPGCAECATDIESEGNRFYRSVILAALKRMTGITNIEVTLDDINAVRDAASEPRRP